jgi:valyl-tRNA synthetase
MHVEAVSRQPMDLFRLEDLVGAVAVAVPPGEGHGRLAGAMAVHPLTGLAIPVVASTTITGLVNPALGPSHCQLCRELGLPLVSAFNPNGEPIELRK